MFLHELSRKLAEDWGYRVDGEGYEKLVRDSFDNRCPYCCCPLTDGQSVIEHLDGMNRYRVGLHVAGNVLVACKKCNSEKRRDDSAKTLPLAESGWASFLSHDGSRCSASCLTCKYWRTVWVDDVERRTRLAENSERIRLFRAAFPELERIVPILKESLAGVLTKLYSDCQSFAENEIRALLYDLSRITAATSPPKTSSGSA